jgi:hypothetical protein
MSETSTTVRFREDVFPRQLREQEERLIKERRIMAGPPQGDEQVGIALSGGGIRSATFCLGLFSRAGPARPRSPDGLSLDRFRRRLFW